MESGSIPPSNPLKCRNFHVNNIIPPPGVDKLILVSAVNVFCQSIVIGFTDSAGGSSDFMLSQTFVMDNADVLRPVI